MSVAIGRRLGPYTILAPLGKGGMGEVYRARDERLEREVAIKVLPDEVRSDPVTLSRFKREARAVAALSHPNVVAIHDIGQDDDVSYVVMELLEGSSLRGAMVKGALPLERVIDYSRQTAAGLAAAHAKGIVHRDIKPENIFVTSDGRVKLLDFGLARMPAREDLDPSSPTITRLTTPGLVVGTLGYMSPEQVHGEPVDARSDIFSFGCVLYEMITARRPFTAETAMRLMTAIVRDEPPVIERPLPAPLAFVLQRCLAKDRAERFQSADDLRRALESIAQSTEGSAGVSASAPTLAFEPSRRRRFPLIGAAVTLAGLIVVATFVVVLPRFRSVAVPAAAQVQQRIDSIAVLPFTNHSGSRENEYLSDGFTEEIINALARVPGLKVISRTSSFALKGQELDIRQIAEKLGVQALVDGSVQRAGEQLRISAQLVDVENGYQLWSASFRREMTDIFAIQEEIATEVASALEVELGVRPRSSPPTRDIAAYELYLKGREASRIWAPDSLDRAITSFMGALQRDPSFAEAWAGLADTYSVFDHTPAMAPLTPEESYRLAIEAAERALSLDPRSAEAHAALGHILTHQGDFERADQHLRRAVELNPSAALTRLWYSVLLRTLGRFDESREQTLRARQLDPLSRLILNIGGNNFWYMNDPARMLEFAESLLTVAPESAEHHRLRARAFSLLGRHDEALRSLEMMQSSGHPDRADEEMILALALAGRRDEMQRRIDHVLDGTAPASGTDDELNQRWRSSTSRLVASGQLLMRAYAAAGDLDEARKWMRVFTESAPEYARVNIDVPPHPAFERFRRDPAFIAARRELGLPDVRR
jgi:eukaryotic-like serine/threonine-protein kinase